MAQNSRFFRQNSETLDPYVDVLNNHIHRKKMGWLLRPGSASFNGALDYLREIGNRLEQKFKLNSVTPIWIAPRTKIVINRIRSCGVYFHAWQNDKKIFIKYFDFHEMHETEFTFCNRLHKINQNNFPEALFYSKEDGYRCIAYEFLVGEILGNIISSTSFTSSERENVIVQLKEIEKTLFEAGVVHRDIHPGNFIVTNDGKLKLIDFEWCVSSEQYEECDFIKKHPLLILNRAGDFSKWCRWDDTDSLLKILEEIGYQENYQNIYREAESFLKEHSGKMVVTHKHRHLLLLPGVFRKLGTLVTRCVKRLRKFV